jgi:hypothetical protein
MAQADIAPMIARAARWSLVHLRFSTVSRSDVATGERQEDVMHHIGFRFALAFALVSAGGAGALAAASASTSTPSAVSARAVSGKAAQPFTPAALRAPAEQATGPTSGQYTAITPFRAFDTRVNSDDKFRRGDVFTIDMLTDYQNNPMIPSTATAISFNVTVADTESTFGFVTIFNGDASAVPGTSTINWVLPGFAIANGGIVALGAPGPYVGQIGVALDGAAEAAAEVIIDVTGYFTP